jgi:hypothetical protein
LIKVNSFSDAAAASAAQHSQSVALSFLYAAPGAETLDREVLSDKPWLSRAD